MKAGVYKNEGYHLMGAAFEVYNDRGYGMAEEIYQECFEIELGLRGIPFASKAELKCFYKGHELKRRYIPDLYVSDSLVVELKAVTELVPEHEASCSITCASPGVRLVTSLILVTKGHWNGSALFCQS
jgi:GxxExxY protein